MPHPVSETRPDTLCWALATFRPGGWAEGWQVIKVNYAQVVR